MCISPMEKSCKGTNINNGRVMDKFFFGGGNNDSLSSFIPATDRVLLLSLYPHLMVNFNLRGAL